MRTSQARHSLRVATLGVAVGALVLGLTFGAVAPANATAFGDDRGAEDERVFYLALGDSVAAGEQPDGETGDGYVDQLWRSIRAEIPTLRLRNVSCGGETSRSMITGKRSPCRYAAGSQLDAAVSFLQRHPGQVAFVTIDVGVNDLFERCLDWDSGLLDQPCAVDQLPRLQKRLAHIVDALTEAGPGVPIIGMTYYDPLLGFWGLVPGGRALARADQRVFALFNAGLVAAYEDAGTAVADVAATFRIGDFTETVVVPGGGRLPVNVALTCRWTWFCSPEFLGDPHPNRTGHRMIARTFERELQRVLHCRGLAPGYPGAGAPLTRSR
jgi:hypothetical protein